LHLFVWVGLLLAMPPKKRNVEQTVMAAVQQNGSNLRFVSEAMKNNEQVVIAAVQQYGLALKFASDEMKSNEQVVMAAVQQDGDNLRFASEEMKSNELVVMAAVQQNGSSLEYASEEMKAKVNAIMMEFKCNDKVAAHALAKPMVLQLFAKYGNDDGHDEPEIIVTCTNPGGNNIASVILKLDCNADDLRQSISTSLGVPPPVLRLILSSGEELRGHQQKTLRELFML